MGNVISLFQKRITNKEVLTNRMIENTHEQFLKHYGPRLRLMDHYEARPKTKKIPAYALVNNNEMFIYGIYFHDDCIRVIVCLYNGCEYLESFTVSNFQELSRIIHSYELEGRIQ